MENYNHIPKQEAVVEAVSIQSKSLHRLASVVSLLMHPLFMPLVGMLAILYHLPYYSLIVPASKFKILSFGFVLTVVIPALFVVLMRFLKVISSFELPSQRERLIPLIISSITLYYTYTFFKDFQALDFISYYMLSCAVGSVIATIVNFFWKISLHSIGLGGVFALYLVLNAAFSSNSHSLVILLVVLFGLVGSARLYLQEHSIAQYVAGFLVGIFSILIVFFAALV